MKSLTRDKSGKLKLVETKAEPALLTTPFNTVKPESSPIVTPENMPKALPRRASPEAKLKQLPLAKPPSKAQLSAILMTKEEFLAELSRLGGKSVTTHQLALLMGPCVKKSVDPFKHHEWDIFHGHVRALARALDDEGKIKMHEIGSKTKKYVYDLVV